MPVVPLTGEQGGRRLGGVSGDGDLVSPCGVRQRIAKEGSSASIAGGLSCRLLELPGVGPIGAAQGGAVLAVCR